MPKHITDTGNQTINGDLTVGTGTWDGGSFTGNQEVLGQLTAPNQTAVNDEDVLTKSLLPRLAMDDMLLPWSFSVSSGSANTGGGVQGNMATITFTTSAVVGNYRYTTLYADSPLYPSGSGQPVQFAQPWTFMFGYDDNNVPFYDTFFIVGRNTSLADTEPTASENCIAFVRRGRDNVELLVCDGTTKHTSGLIPAPITSLSAMTKLCLVWDGSTLYLYGAYWTGGTEQPRMSLISSLTPGGPLPAAMDYRRIYFTQIATSGPFTYTPVAYIGPFMFARKALHPI